MESAGDFLVYLNIIRKRLWLIILLLIVTVGVILAISYTAKPVYRATVRLQVLATDSAAVSLFTEYRASSTTTEIQQAQNDFMRALKSGFVAWRTIADLNLEIGALDLLAGLSTAVEGDYIVVTVESDDPASAEGIASRQVDNALTYYREGRATPSRVLLTFVTEQLSAAQQGMLDAENALFEFKKAHQIDSIDQETRALQDLTRNLRLERDRAEIEMRRADVFAGIYRAEQLKATQQADAIERAELELQAAAAEEAASAGTSAGVDEQSPAEFAPYTKKYYLDVARGHEATAIGYEAKRDGYAQSLTFYDDMISARSAELESLIKLYGEYNALARDLTRANANYTFLRDKQNEATLKQLQAERLGYIQITEPARKPDAPVPSKLPQFVAVGAVVSVLTGFVLSFFLEFVAALRKAARKQRVS
jgi:uncharacterized protein involved in exopolysaccharide biosynthesis